MTHLSTIGFQAVNFLLLLFILHRYLWKPVRATIERRKKEIDDAAAGVKARAKAADESRARYEAKAEAADLERARLLAATAVTLAADREKVLAEARSAMDAERQAAREKLDEERSTAAGELTDATLDVALSLAQRMLGEMRGPAIAGAFLERICERIDGLPAGEIASLRGDLEGSSTIHVATAPALDDEAKARLGARLARSFGAAVKLDFVVDDGLIAGAELRFPHARLCHSFQHSLAAARKELSTHGVKAVTRPELTTHPEIVDK